MFGTSGRKLLTRLVEQGYVDPSDVNDCIHGSLKKKAKSISESLFGTLNEHQIFLIRKSWNHIVFLEQSIQELEERIDELLEPYQEEVGLLLTAPGIKKHAASIIAEIGTDMNQFLQQSIYLLGQVSHRETMKVLVKKVPEHQKGIHI